MSGLEALSVLIGLLSLALLTSNYKKMRERILKISIPDVITKDDITVGAKIRYENLSSYYIPNAETTIQGFIGNQLIFDAKRILSFDPHDRLDATLDLRKKLEERSFLSKEIIEAKGLRISIDCYYHQTVLWNRWFLFRQRIHRRYVWDKEMDIWRHPYNDEWV
jgi:hypothetical protein